MDNGLDAYELKRMFQECGLNSEKTTSLLNRLPYAAMIINSERKLLASNEAADSIGVEVGTYCWHTFGKLASIPEKDRVFFEKFAEPPESGTRCTFCRADEALETGTNISVKLSVDGVVWDTNWLPLNDGLFLHYAIDITGRE